MQDENLINTTREEAHKAIQTHLQSLYGSCYLTDWVVVAETISDDDEKMLYIALSNNCSSWSVRGMMWTACKQLFALLS